MKKWGSLLLVTLMIFGVVGIAAAKGKPLPEPDQAAKEQLGELLYFDQYLSANKNQSCASCHDPNTGFVDPINIRFPGAVGFPTSLGSDQTSFGGRNAPMAAYALNSPPFFFDGELWVGGQFWDGRADTLAEQAKGPFLNPVEMAMPDRAAVIDAMFADDNRNKNAYEVLFPAAFPGINMAQVDQVYDAMALAIEAFEMTQPFNEFSSKFDYVLTQGYVGWDEIAGLTILQQGNLKKVFSDSEIRGMEVFFDDTTGGGQCVLCHMPPDFTDFTYDNLGIPKSTNTIISDNPDDLGLYETIANLETLYPYLVATRDSATGADADSQKGKFKVMTLRNVELTAPYGHNSFFATLEEIVHFYNTRDVPSEGWADPEVDLNVNDAELGNLGLTAAEEADLVAFLKTLTDGYQP